MRNVAPRWNVDLELDPKIAVERFRSRRRSLRERTVEHAEGDIDDDDLEQLIADATTAIAQIGRGRAGATGVRVDGSLDEAYAALMVSITEAGVRLDDHESALGLDRPQPTRRPAMRVLPALTRWGGFRRRAPTGALLEAPSVSAAAARRQAVDVSPVVPPAASAICARRRE
jgi:hypothetical protein